MPKEIQVCPELCCGCMLCSLIRSALHHDSFWPSKAYVTVRGNHHRGDLNAVKLEELGFLPEGEQPKDAVL